MKKNCVKKLEDNINFVNEYLANPLEFISSHSNKENFFAIFSNYTKSDSIKHLNDYLDANNKELQNVIDRLNNIQNNNVFNWEYDTQKRKFIIPDEIKNYSDGNKWLVILSILKTMDTFPMNILSDINKNIIDSPKEKKFEKKNTTIQDIKFLEESLLKLKNQINESSNSELNKIHQFLS